MKIISLELYKYIRFDFTGILRFYMVINNPIITILGSNGSGKSSLLKECTPLPASRPDFGPDGFKIIKIYHENSEYCLTSNFSKKDKPHSFEKDGTELNHSGTTGIQNELIEKYLGYTTDVYAILNGPIKFTEMSSSVRKAVLLAYNPHKLGFIIDKHKAASSLIRSYQANLSHLYDRKVILEGEFLDKELEKHLTQEHDYLTAELLKIIEFTHRLKEQINQLERSWDPNVELNLVGIRRQLRDIIHKSIRYKEVPRANLTEYVAQLKSQITENQTIITTTNEQTQSYIEEINKYSQYAQDDNHKELAKEFRQKIAGLKIEIVKLEKGLIKNPFDQILLDDIPSHCEKLINILNNFIGCGENLQTPEIIEQYRYRLDKYQRRLQQYSYEHDHKTDQLTEVSRHLIREGPDPACVSTICPLLLAYRKDQELVQYNYNTLAEELRKIEHKGTRCSRLVNKLKERVDYLNQYAPHLNRLSSYLGTFGHLRIPLRELDIIQILRSQPFNIVAKIRDYYERSMDYYKCIDMQQQLETYLTKYTQITTSEETDRDFIQSIIKEKQDVLISLREKIVHLTSCVEELNSTLKLVLEYQYIVVGLDEYRNKVTEYEKQSFIKYDIDVYRKLKSALEQQQVISTTRLSEITRILRNQETLRIRYEEEVVSQIKIIEQQKLEMSYIEKALSPNSGIPHKYTVQFINALIRTANYFISRIWSYPLEIVEVDFGDNLTYKFAIKVGDVHVSDISTCSEAQQEIINITFMLALIIQLKLTDYVIYPDEWGRSFDLHHKQRLLELLTMLIDESIVSQMFLVNHDIAFSGGLINNDVIVLNSANILVPEVYNTTVDIELG